MSAAPSGVQPRAALAVVVLALAPFSLGYLLSQLFRAVNAIIEKDLVADVGLGPADLGLVTAAYLAAFALFQAPLGVLLDRFGPRRVQAALLSVAAMGAFLFATGEDVITLIVARAMIGLGFAGGLMASFKAVVIWVSAPRRALANALVMSSGGIGVLAATAPMEWATQAFGWRDVFLALAGANFVVAMIILLAVPERASGTSSVTIWQQIRETGAIFSDRAFLCLTPLLATTTGCHIAIQTLWAGPWFRDVAGYDRNEVAFALLLMAAAFFVGILLTGWVADWLVRRGVSLLATMLCFMLLFLGSQVAIVLGWTGALMLANWMVFGMLGQVSVLAFAWLAAYFGAARSGRAHTAANLVIFSTAFAMQYAIGAIIELYPRTPTGGYETESYTAAVGVALGLQLLALGWYLINIRHVPLR
ncbi:MAG: MFS transporter [Hyphomicrobiaceae bacterium]